MVVVVAAEDHGHVADSIPVEEEVRIVSSHSIQEEVQHIVEEPGVGDNGFAAPVPCSWEVRVGHLDCSKVAGWMCFQRYCSDRTF